MEKCQYDELKAYQGIYWWFVGKREIVIDFAENHADLKRKHTGQRILDVGCGMGLTLEALSEYGDIYGLDMEEEAVRYCNESLAIRGIPQNVYKGSLPDDIPFSENSFDFIFALDVIEHVEDDEAALRALKKILKPNGKLIITVPALMSMWSYNDELNHHFRRYEIQELTRKVKAAGLSIIKCSFYNSYLYIPAKIIRTVKNILQIKKSDVRQSTKNGIINRILKYIFSSEKKHLRNGSFKKGVSLIMACSKEV